MKTDWRSESKPLLVLLALFLGSFFLPVGQARFDHAVSEGLQLLRWYAREHVVLCLLPAFFIAGAIGTFVRQDAVMKHLGAGAPRVKAYGVASVSGTILAVCSCTVLPLFAGIWRMGAGLGPAVAFLYSGPAISALSIIMTARILGPDLGLARAVGAISFSVIIGLAMTTLFRRSEATRAAARAPEVPAEAGARTLGQTSLWIGLMVAVLIFANWSEAESSGFFGAVARGKWWLTGLAGAGIGLLLLRWFAVKVWKILALLAGTVAVALAVPAHPTAAFAAAMVGLGWLTSTEEGELGDWFTASWDFAKQITPLLLGGVLVSGILLGRPGQEGLVPNQWVETAVGGEGLGANLFASVVGAFMYFATLTEIPILQGLLGSGMGQGPALTLLLAGPALSLPSLLALRLILGGRKTLVYLALVIVMSTLAGWLYGNVIASPARATAPQQAAPAQTTLLEKTANPNPDWSLS